MVYCVVVSCVNWFHGRADRAWLVCYDVMAFRPNEKFWEPKNFQLAQRMRCKFHSDLLGFNVWVSTSWKREDEGLGSERYEVRATASSTLYCQDHLGATDDRIITKNAWDSAAPNVTWDFFPQL